MIQMEVQLKLVQVQKMMYIDLERQLVYSATQCYTVQCKNTDDKVRYYTNGSAAQTCASAKDDVNWFGKIACIQCYTVECRYTDDKVRYYTNVSAAKTSASAKDDVNWFLKDSLYIVLHSRV